MFAQLAQDVEFVRPAIDWHAAAPELTLLGFGALVTLMDIIWLERGRRLTSAVASIALLVTMIPILTLAIDGTDRSMFNGAFIVDDYALVMKGLFVLAGYVVILLSTNYVAEGDYWENEYYGLLLSSVSSEEIDEEAIERLKEGDILESTFTEFAEQSPELYAALIDERDRFMAARLRDENRNHAGSKVLVVVGAGHLEGLASYLAEAQEDPQEQVETLAALPPRSLWPKLIPWAILALVLTGFFIGFSRSPELGIRLVAIWVVINGGLAALGALLARAHPLTVVSAMLAAPLTSLNPAVAAGMVTGLVESWLRKPKVSDLEQLHADAMTLKGWYANPATRILLVFLFSNFGSAIGTWVAGFRIFNVLS